MNHKAPTCKQAIFLLSLGAAVLAFFAGYSVRYILEKDAKFSEAKREEGTNMRRNTLPESAIDYEAAVEEVSIDSIHGYFRYFTSFPHVGGTQESLQQANYMADKLRQFGFDKVELKKYNALLSVPRVPGNVSMTDENSTVLFSSTILEKPLTDAEGDHREIYPFNAYTASGQAEGELVYVNYGRRSDFETLEKLNISLRGKIVIMRYGKNFRGDKVNLAEKAGASGAILYSDPADFSSSVNYPNSWFLPETGIQRGNILRQKGDPLSPGYPSVEGAFRMKSEHVKYLHTIPVQPISFKDAKILLSQLDGEAIPKSSWQGNLEIVYNITSKTRKIVRISVDVPLVDKPIYNVIGTIHGSKEPDRMLLIGNHRDAWTYGAGDPSSGTAAMMETSRILGDLKSRGWRPRRTLLVCSWDAEEYGLMGSKEWVEEYAALLSYRAIAYLNIDIAVQGNHTLRVKSSPHLAGTFQDVVKMLKVPGSDESLFDDWVNKTPDPKKEREPKIYMLGAGSDFTPFYSVIGVPAIDFRYTFNEKSMHLASYPVYHTIYDNYNWMTKFVDPDFRYHKIITQIWLKLSLTLLDSVIIPFDLTRYSGDLLDYINSFTETHSQQLNQNGVDLGLLSKAARDFNTAAANFKSREAGLDFQTSLDVRAYNDQIMELERCFIKPGGLKRRPNFKHVLYSPSSVNIYLGRALPAVTEAINRAQNGIDKDWDNVQIQIAIVINHIHMATKMLEEIR